MRWRLAVLALALGAAACGAKKKTCCTDEKGHCLELAANPSQCCDPGLTVQQRPALPDGGCTAPPSTPGNSCDSAETLVVPPNGGFIKVSGDDTEFVDHVSCTAGAGDVVAGGRDHVYRISSDHHWAVRGRADGGTLHFNFSTCAVPVQAPCAKGWVAPDVVFDVPELALADLPPGDHFLWVEAPGPYTLDLDFFTSPLLHDCSQPLPVSFGGDGGVVTDVADMARGYFLQPAPLTGESSTRAYSLYLTQPMRVQTQVSQDAGWQVWLDGAPSCADYTQQPQGPSVTTLDESLPKGFHYVRMLATGDTSAPALFTTTFTATAFPPGNCTQPLPLTAVADGGVEEAQASGDTTGAFAELSAQCAQGSPDVTYVLTLNATRNLTATVTTPSATFRPAVALRAGDCNATDAACELAAAPGAGATLSAPALPAGDYFLWVSGEGSSGPFTLDVTLTP